MLKSSDIRIRDPFILPLAQEGKYYLFGTTDVNAWSGDAVGFDCYSSADLENWEGPIAAFRPPVGFWATENYWAPEVHLYNGRYYMFASFYAPGRMRATQILSADRPEGPYTLWSDGPVTPPDWMCLDGTLYVDEDGAPWIVFCHEWLQVRDGGMCALRLSSDLRHAVGEPVTLFHASEAGWTSAFTDRRFSNEEGCYVTDGPFLVRDEEKRLFLFWASFRNGSYAEGYAVSESGLVTGPWLHNPVPLFERDGGHGMLFTSFDGKLLFTLHRPNSSPDERPVFFRLDKQDDVFSIKEQL